MKKTGIQSLSWRHPSRLSAATVAAVPQILILTELKTQNNNVSERSDWIWNQTEKRFSWSVFIFLTFPNKYLQTGSRVPPAQSVGVRGVKGEVCAYQLKC